MEQQFRIQSWLAVVAIFSLIHTSVADAHHFWFSESYTKIRSMIETFYWQMDLQIQTQTVLLNVFHGRGQHRLNVVLKTLNKAAE